MLFSIVTHLVSWVLRLGVSKGVGVGNVLMVLAGVAGGVVVYLVCG